MSEQPTTTPDLAKQPLYRVLAGLVIAIETCEESGNTEWKDKHKENLHKLVEEHMPSGFGFNSGTWINRERSHGDKLLFYTSFQHMNEGGYYEGWTNHTVTVRPSLFYGIELKIGGRNRNDIKSHIEEVFAIALKRLV